MNDDRVDMLRARELKEKGFVTLMSVLASIGLVLAKLTIGLISGSVALLADAAHSGIDLLASLVTFFAVRIAGRPPDAEHHYGHGKVENLAAVFEVFLLAVTALWISVESFRRLVSPTVEVEVTVWTVVVPLAGIGVDYWRSGRLMEAARKFKSQALEADALNFRTDMYTSAVVVLGLIVVSLGKVEENPLLAKADAAAALIVVLFVIFIALRLGKEALNSLLDTAPAELAQRIQDEVESIPDVLTVESVRVRESGSHLFTDIVVGISRTESLARAHDLTERVERKVREIEPRSDVIVHVEPTSSEGESIVDAVRAAARRLGLNTHDERVHRVTDGYHASLHLEMEPNSGFEEAHALSERLETAVKDAVTEVRSVQVHLEPGAGEVVTRHDITRSQPQMVSNLEQVAQSNGARAAHQIRVYRLQPTGHIGDVSDEYDIFLECGFDQDLPLEEVHMRTELMERSVRDRYPGARHVVIHAEPARS